MKKTLIWFLLFFGLAQPALAMKQPLFGAGTPSVSATNYAGFSGAFSATNGVVTSTIAPIAGITEGLYVKLISAPAAGKSYVYTLLKNGSATSATCTISDSETTCSSSVFVAFSAGDMLTLRTVPSGTPTSTYTMFSTVFNSGTGGISMMNISASSTNPSASSTEITGVCGALNWNGSSRGQKAAKAGTFSKLYVALTTAPGAGKSRQVNILKNSVATSVTCTISEALTTCNDTSNSFSIAQGDDIWFQEIPTGTPAASAMSIGLAFTTGIDGESMYLWTRRTTGPSNSVDNYISLIGDNVAYSTTENTLQFSVPVPMVVKELYYKTANAPGTGKSFSFFFRVNSASSTLTCTNSESATTCTDTSNQVSLTTNDAINYLSTPSGTPTSSSSSQLGVIMFMDPRDKIYGSTLYGSTIL